MSGPDAARPFLLGIVGDSGSGKRTVADAVRALMGPARTSAVELDDYHRFTRAERRQKGLTALNPAVHDLDLLQAHLALLRRGKSVKTRPYDHADGTFGPARTVEPGEIVLVRGLLGWPTDAARESYDLTVFLLPEPELLFRWKLRRDTRVRGYAEAEVLKSIAAHLLDAKEYVLPQAARADLVVHYEIPEWDAPDAELTVRVEARRAAAAVVNALDLPARLGRHVRVETHGAATVVRVGAELPAASVDAWGRDAFPDTYDAAALGAHEGEAGPERLPALAFVQLLVADLARRLRDAAPAPLAGAAA